MSAAGNSIDSSITSLAIAEEVLGVPKTLSSPTWYPLEPNSYSEFGAQVKNVKREPIISSRQKRKGVVVGLEEIVGLNLDFTSKTPYYLMQGFMFADWRAKDNLLSTTTTLTTTYNVASGGAAFLAGDLVFGENFTNSANNGLHLVASSTGTTVVTSGLVNETAPATATITRVGRQGASGDYTITLNGNGQPCLNTTAGNFSTLGIIPGEWVWVGGDTAVTQFATAAANGFYRVLSVANLQIVFDRWPGANPGAGTYTAAVDAGAAKTVQVFVGHAIKNEATTALQKFRTYQLERYLGGTRYQYALGMGANSLKINVKESDKLHIDLGYVGMDEDLSQVAAKAGTRAALPAEVAFNAASSCSRLRLIGADGFTPLTAVLTDLSLSIDNGLKPLYAITNNAGAVDLMAGDFTVAGSVTAYLSTLAAVTAVRTNPDCSVDTAMVDNVNGFATGWLFDVPLLMLGDGRMKVEKDKPVTLPLTLEAAGHTVLNHTLMAMRFAYLPQLAL